MHPIRELQKDPVDLLDRFSDIMHQFEEELLLLCLEPGDRDTCELIVYSFNKNGVSDEFYDDIRLALCSNDRVVAALKGTPLEGLFFKNPIKPPCSTEVFHN